MEYGVLGPLTMTAGGRDLLAKAPKPRQLTALLLLNHDQFVATGDCVEELWGGSPPRTVVATLQTYIVRIRGSLTAGLGGSAEARARLVTGRRGYYLQIHDERLDVLEFQRLAQEARRAVRRRDDEQVSRTARRALALWRGPALSDVQTGPHLSTLVDALEETRTIITGLCFESELRLGFHHDLLAELSLTAARNPLNEKLQAQHMLALYRSGRQADALQVFHRLRKTLADDLGLGPSEPVQNLHRAMLAADASLNIDWKS
jgi:DNA-binding SARP family transcriptional activator